MRSAWRKRMTARVAAAAITPCSVQLLICDPSLSLGSTTELPPKLPKRGTTASIQTVYGMLYPALALTWATHCVLPASVDDTTKRRTT